MHQFVPSRHGRGCASLVCLIGFLCAWLPCGAGAQPTYSGTSYVVTTLVDELDTTLAPGTGAGTSLREAVAYSAAGDSIAFDATLAGTIYLGLGEIAVAHDIIITGPGRSTIEINGLDNTRLISIPAGVSARLSGVTLSGGRALTGGCILNAGWLDVANCALLASTAVQEGGAIRHTGTALSVSGCTFERNISYLDGGAIAAANGTLTIVYCMFRGNAAGRDGAAIALTGGTLTAAGSEFEGNSAAGSGGAISLAASATGGATRSTFVTNRSNAGGALHNAGTLSLHTCTVSGNVSNTTGGGIISSGTATATFCTIAFNISSGGGGLYATGTFTPTACIFADNSAPTGTDVHGVVTSLGGNLAGIADGGSGWTTTDVTGTVAKPASASLDELRYNGGGTRTHALLVCSRAVEIADSTGTWNQLDQRGLPRKMNGDGDAHSFPDAGAFEAQSALDTEPPQITPYPGFVVQLDSTGNATIVRDTLLLYAMDNCEVVDRGINKTTFTCADTGEVIVTLTATDRSHNTASQNVTVYVRDVTAPVITAPADITTTIDAGTCTRAMTLAVPTATDACSVPTVTGDPPAVFPVGTTAVRWVATDDAGNEAIAMQYVTVADNIPPTITAPAAVLRSAPANNCALPFSAARIGTPTVSENCGDVIVQENAPASFPPGTTIVTWTATDAAGNSATATQQVTVVDSIPPLIHAAPDVTVSALANSCTRDAASIALGTPVASDNCTLATVTNNAPTSYPIGSTLVTWKATDSTGNTSTSVQVVTVIDDTPPSIQAPADITVPVDPGKCYWTVNPAALGTPTSADNCGVPSVASTAGATLDVGTHRVVWTTTDSHGNKATDVQIVTVVGAPPTITCPAGIVKNTDPGMAGAVVTYVPPVGGSGCVGAETIRTGGLPSGSFFPVGTTTVSYMVVDASNQTATCSFTVKVEDHEAPVVSVEVAPRYLWPQDNKMKTIIATVDVSDNVPGAAAVLTSITCNQNANGDISGATTGVFDNIFDLRAKRDNSGQRLYTVLYTATDVAGNSSTGSAVVTVPTQKPKDVETEELPVPAAVTLEQNYPNPFNPTTTITFGLPEDGFADLRIYDAMGRQVRIVVNDPLTAGIYTVRWDGMDDRGVQAPSGMYIYFLQAASQRLERKMLLTR